MSPVIGRFRCLTVLQTARLIKRHTAKSSAHTGSANVWLTPLVEHLSTAQDICVRNTPVFCPNLIKTVKSALILLLFHH